MFGFILGFISGCQLMCMLYRYSYIELTERLARCSKRKRERIERTMQVVIWETSGKARTGWDAIVNGTIGLSNFVTLYKWLCWYNRNVEKKVVA